MTDLNMPPAGWYPDPQADNTERWWGGTDWTASTRPLNDTPAAPQAPVPAAVALPPAGWYPDPQNAAGEKWFDGADWTQVTRPRADQPPPGGAGLPGTPRLPGLPAMPGLLGSLSSQIQQGARDPQGFYRGHRQGIDTAAAGALIVDGLVGLPTRRGNRSGVFGSLVGIVVGLVFVVVGVFLSSAMKTPANMSATMTGKVTSVTVSHGTTTSSSNSRTRTSTSTSTCSPVAGFMVDGKAYTASTSAGVSPCPWAVGQPIDVAYDPASPELATIPSKGGVQYMPLIFGGAGALLAIASVFSFIRSVTELGAGGFLLMRMWKRRRAATSPA
jgi:hypothetical protein